jgi:hypothetical protein
MKAEIGIAMSPDRRRRLEQVSRLSAAGCLLLALPPFILLPVIWFVGGLLPLLPSVPDGPPPSALFRALGLAVTLLPPLVMAWGLLRLRGFFLGLAAGETFSADGARRLRDFGTALLARAVLAPLAGAGASVAATWERGVGERMLAINFSDADLAYLVVAGLVFTLSWTLSEAAEMAEEQRLIV